MIAASGASGAVPLAAKGPWVGSAALAGEGGAQLVLGLMSRRSVGILNTSTLTTSLPVAASKAIARSEMPRSSTAVVSQTRPLATTGVDQPRPGTGDFHAMLLVSLHSTGSPR